MPVAICVAVETDGQLPSGQSLVDAMEQTDATTARHPAYYMINGAHPTHFEHVMRDGGTWRDRIRGLRANASKRSHAELDSSPDLAIGNPAELGGDYRTLRDLPPHLAVLGGGGGTDHRHVEAIHAAGQNPPSLS
jgi:S-methylmethionine-dependent homocysteine/selenocysteine methylase